MRNLCRNGITIHAKVAMSQPYIDGNADAIDSFVRTLRDIHIHKITVPEPLWWKS